MDGSVYEMGKSCIWKRGKKHTQGTIPLWRQNPPTPTRGSGILSSRPTSEGIALVAYRDQQMIQLRIQVVHLHIQTADEYARRTPRPHEKAIPMNKTTHTYSLWFYSWRWKSNDSASSLVTDLAILCAFGRNMKIMASRMRCTFKNAESLAHSDLQR